MQVVSLQAGAASAQWVPARGGLLASLHLAAEGALTQGAQPVLWQPGHEFWLQNEETWLHGGMPVLFPFAGRVWLQGEEGFYQVGKQRYPMPIHVFAHRFSWQVEAKTQRELCLAFASEAATLLYFPWHFRLRIYYVLTEVALHCRLSIRNLGHVDPRQSSQAMPVSGGFHPYFYLPAAQNLRQQSSLEFASEEVQLVTGQGAAGLIKPGSSLRVRHLHEPCLHSLILRKVSGNTVSMYRPNFHDSIHVKAAYHHCNFVLWSRPADDFFCVEPWMGLPDAIHSGEGLRLLAKGEDLTFAISIALQSHGGTP